MDGGSTDGSLDKEFLNQIGVRGILTIRAKGQGSAYRAGFFKAVEDAYEYAVTVDGNNKDSVEQIPEFINLLETGYDFVQGSRFMEGGYHKNTPKAREWAIRFFSNPLLSLVSGFRYTETMSAFRGFNTKILADKRLQIFREVFQTWELQWYLSSRIPRLGYRVMEIPQARFTLKASQFPRKLTGRETFVLFYSL